MSAAVNQLGVSRIASPFSKLSISVACAKNPGGCLSSECGGKLRAAADAAGQAATGIFCACDADGQFAEWRGDARNAKLVYGGAHCARCDSGWRDSIEAGFVSVGRAVCSWSTRNLRGGKCSAV